MPRRVGNSIRMYQAKINQTSSRWKSKSLINPTTSLLTTNNLQLQYKPPRVSHRPHGHRLGPRFKKSDSIISTTTTTERWTRPDGTVESRRVFKRRFADGREVEEETHDFEPKREPETPSLQQMPWPIGPEETNSQTQPPKLVQDKQSRIATPVQDELKREHRQRGWFWN